MRAVEELLQSEIRLPSPPAIAARIVDIVKREDCSFKELAAVIESDPALVARILRLANSSFYGVPKMVNSIDKAISVLGLNALKNLALSFILAEAFKGQPSERFDFDRFSRRALTAAVAGQLISDQIDFKCDETFITCLLQDIGVAAMFMCRKDDYVKVLDERMINQLPLSVIENQVFGFDHQEVGAELLKLWGLPESVYLPIRYHHENRNVPPQFEKLCNVIRASDRLSAVYYGSSSIKNVREVTELLSSTFALPENQSAALIDSVAGKSLELLSQFEMDPGRIKPFSQILQEANQELSRLNFSYEMLVLDHTEAKQRAERLAVELKSANDKLRILAFRDDLTGLHNFRSFQEAMTKELGRAERYQRPLALLLFDVDHFKNVNDTYGHLGGDLVLQTVAHEIQRTTRQTDFVARYAGDEFAIILSDTTEKGALRKAESCRATIEAAQTQVTGKVIRVTVSVGVAFLDLVQGVHKEEFINAADRALYQSKLKGRNRITGPVW